LATRVFIFEPDNEAAFELGYSTLHLLNLVPWPAPGRNSLCFHIPSKKCWSVGQWGSPCRPSDRPMLQEERSSYDSDWPNSRAGVEKNHGTMTRRLRAPTHPHTQIAVADKVKSFFCSHTLLSRYPPFASLSFCCLSVPAAPRRCETTFKSGCLEEPHASSAMASGSNSDSNASSQDTGVVVASPHPITPVLSPPAQQPTSQIFSSNPSSPFPLMVIAQHGLSPPVLVIGSKRGLG